MIFMNEEEFLTNETIERLTENMTEKYLEAAGKRAGNRVSFSLTVQEILLRFRDLYGTETPCKVIGQKNFGKIVFTIRQKGPQLDPTDGDKYTEYSYDILAGIGVMPKYS